MCLRIALDSPHAYRTFRKCIPLPKVPNRESLHECMIIYIRENFPVRNFPGFEHLYSSVFLLHSCNYSTGGLAGHVVTSRQGCPTASNNTLSIAAIRAACALTWILIPPLLPPKCHAPSICTPPSGPRREYQPNVFLTFLALAQFAHALSPVNPSGASVESV
jgi:hypothetical protein